jgi:hypothetical protein
VFSALEFREDAFFETGFSTGTLPEGACIVWDVIPAQRALRRFRNRHSSEIR